VAIGHRDIFAAPYGHLSAWVLFAGLAPQKYENADYREAIPAKNSVQFLP